MLQRSILIALSLLMQAGGRCLAAPDDAPPYAHERSTIRLISTYQAEEAAATSDAAPEDSGWQLPHSMEDTVATEAPPFHTETETHFVPPPTSLEEYSPENYIDDGSWSESPAEPFVGKLTWLGFRHSATHGRHAGRGVPLAGTSWLNRPYYIGADLGPMWITHPPRESITDDVDLFGGLYAGLDWDYYWGVELAVQRATPELFNQENWDAPRGDRLMLWSASLMYYPWGDSMFRPYWRCGLGAMEIDYPTIDGRRDETLWAVPIGLGIKYPIRRWLVTRAELTDNIGLGNDGTATQHNWSLTLALEWRFGFHHRSYWPWNPSRHIW